MGRDKDHGARVCAVQDIGSTDDANPRAFLLYRAGDLFCLCSKIDARSFVCVLLSSGSDAVAKHKLGPGILLGRTCQMLMIR